MTKRHTRAKSKETQGQWARVLWLDREVRDGRYPSPASLQAAFGIRRRAAFLTITFLRDSLGAPLEYDRRRGGYRYSDPTYALPTVYLQEGELLALFLAEQATRQYLGTPLEAPLRAAIEKLCRYLPEEVRVGLQDLADGFQLAGASSVEVPLSLLAEVQQAVRAQQVLRMVYYTPRRDATQERDVEPHFLRNVRGDWMLVAWDRWRGEPREFMLSRIQQYQRIEERFTRRPTLNPETYARHTFLTEHGAEPYEVVLRFDAYQARWIRERTWHPSQLIEEHPDGTLTLRLTVTGEGDLLRWILGYGSHVEVRAPTWLRERVAEEARRMAMVYSGDGRPPSE